MSARLRDLVAGERIRLLSLRSTHAFLGCAFVVAVAAAWLLCAKLDIRPEDRASYRSVNDAFNSDTGSLLMTIAGCFGAASATGEYTSGLIRTVFTATPARARVLLAKALVLTAATAIAGAAATTGVIVVSQGVLAPGHSASALSEPGGWTAAVAFTLLMPLGAITGLALGTLLRRPATAVAAVVIVLTLLPDLLSGLIGPAAWELTAYGAWSVLAGQQHPGAAASAGLSWLVLAAWPAVAGTLAVLAVQRRDV
jgi:ABC-2 type transport system permease protein